jgi:hypothetical protein
LKNCLLGIAESDTLDPVERAEPCKIGGHKPFCLFPRDPEFPGFRGEPHGGRTMINPDKHSSNPIGWMT